jgi:KipI family sensor histidine kinase inhibitor
VIFPEPRFSPLGDGAVTITLGDEMSPEMSDRVIAATNAIERESSGELELVPSYAAVIAFYDGARSSYREILARLEIALGRVRAGDKHNPMPVPRLVRINVIYDGSDLPEVARRTAMTRQSVVEIHSSREYRVYMLGFAPGFAYLGDLDQRLSLPRRDSPRKRVPAGSVAIAETQTAVYPSSTPGGWHLIGRTEMVMFDPHRDPPATLRVGDRVRFEPADG